MEVEYPNKAKFYLEPKPIAFESEGWKFKGRLGLEVICEIHPDIDLSPEEIYEWMNDNPLTALTLSCAAIAVAGLVVVSYGTGVGEVATGVLGGGALVTAGAL